MPKVAEELKALEVKRITAPGFHAVGGVPGLLLRVKPSGARNWVLRAVVGNKRRDMGLGGFPGVPLGEAREQARKCRRMISDGLDPVEESRKRKQALRAEQETRISFAKAWREFWADRSAELGAKTARHWKASIENYALPVIGQQVVADLETRHIEDVLRPIWESKTVTAKKLRARLENVLSWATVKGYRSGDNPARWKDNLKEILPRPSKVYKAQNFRALPIADAPKFMAALAKRHGNAARALEFAILTAARSGEVRGARWDEIDLDAGRWKIPAERMKMERPHLVPLSDAARRLLESMPHESELIFPAPRGGMLSDMTLLAVLKRMGWIDRTTVHGFRAVFKSWSLERTDYPDFVSEMALAHAVGDEIQKAYQRSDLMAKRRGLMRQWAKYLGFAEAGGKVTPIRKVQR
jgi:integrase